MTSEPISQREARRLKAQNKELIRMLRRIEHGGDAPNVERVTLQEVVVDVIQTSTAITAIKCGYDIQLRYSRTQQPSGHGVFDLIAIRRRSLDAALFEQFKVKFGKV